MSVSPLLDSIMQIKVTEQSPGVLCQPQQDQKALGSRQPGGAAGQPCSRLLAFALGGKDRRAGPRRATCLGRGSHPEAYPSDGCTEPSEGRSVPIHWATGPVYRRELRVRVHAIQMRASFTYQSPTGTAHVCIHNSTHTHTCKDISTHIHTSLYIQTVTHICTLAYTRSG